MCVLACIRKIDCFNKSTRFSLFLPLLHVYIFFFKTEIAVSNLFHEGLEMTLLDLEASMLAQQRQQQQSDDAGTAVGMSNDLPSSSDANVPVEQQSVDDRIVPDPASFSATDPLQLQPVTLDNPLLAITPTTPIADQ